jgi:hypothetical protein
VPPLNKDTSGNASIMSRMFMFLAGVPAAALLTVPLVAGCGSSPTSP